MRLMVDGRVRARAQPFIGKGIRGAAVEARAQPLPSSKQPFSTAKVHRRADLAQRGAVKEAARMVAMQVPSATPAC